MMHLEQIDHVALRCASPEATKAWYVSTLGFEHLFPDQWSGIPIVLRLGSTYITLFPQKENQQVSAEGQAWHLAFRAATYANFRSAQAELQARGVSFQFQNHEIAHSIYFFDPDGFLLEITTYDIPKDEKEVASNLEPKEKPMTPFRTSREIPAAVEQVFAAISDPRRLERWWGPAGFTNTFSVCEFKNGGRWILTMHGPDGKNYPNEYVFAEIESPHRVVVQHIGEPKFRLTITLASSGGPAAGTVVSWSQAFESSEVAKRIEHIVVPANDQNLQRLAGEVLRESAGE